MRYTRNVMTFCLTAMISAAASAQVKPWDLFDDPLSDSLCDVINVANGELVVLTATGELVFVSGPDVVLEDTFVDVQGNVFYVGQPAGFLDFSTDADGLRSLWWLAITGEVVSVNGFTGEPTVTNLRPTNFEDVACDACDFWDDPSVCAEPPDNEPPIIINFCGMNTGMSLALTAFGMGLMRTRRRAGWL